MKAKRLLSRLVWFVSGFLAAFVLIAIIRRYPPSFTEAQFDEIRENMTKDEIAERLRCPPGDYRPAIWRHPDWYTSTTDLMGSLVKLSGESLDGLKALELQESEEWLKNFKAGGARRLNRRIEHFEWWGRDYGIRVTFDKEGAMIHRSLWSMSPPRPPHGPLRYAQWWLGW